MPRKGVTGHDEWVITEALATALIALEQLPPQHQPRTHMDDIKKLLGARCESETVPLHLAQAKCRLFPDLDYLSRVRHRRRRTRVKFPAGFYPPKLYIQCPGPNCHPAVPVVWSAWRLRRHIATTSSACPVWNAIRTGVFFAAGPSKFYPASRFRLALGAAMDRFIQILSVRRLQRNAGHHDLAVRASHKANRPAI